MFGTGQDLTALSNLLSESSDATDGSGTGSGGAKPFSPADMVASAPGGAAALEPPHLLAAALEASWELKFAGGDMSARHLQPRAPISPAAQLKLKKRVHRHSSPN